MLAYHLRHAIRRLMGEPAFTLTAILTLGLGVGANVAVFGRVGRAAAADPVGHDDDDAREAPHEAQSALFDDVFAIVAAGVPCRR